MYVLPQENAADRLHGLRQFPQRTQGITKAALRPLFGDMAERIPL